MKVAVLFLLPSIALGFGTVTLRPPAYSSSGNYRPEGGLYIREPISNEVFYQSWSGGRIGKWVSTTHDVMYQVNERTAAGIGQQYNYRREDGQKEAEFRANVTIEYRLWD